MTTRKKTDRRPTGKVLYHESFAKGPGAWTTGRAFAEGHWHRNFYGQHGGPVPLGWAHEPGGASGGGAGAGAGAGGGYAYTEPPWYFDDNHGELFWLYLAFFINRSKQVKLAGKDLRGANIHLRLRGRGLALRSSRLYFWIQGKPGQDKLREGEQFAYFNWSLTSQSIAAIPEGRWTDHHLQLNPDEMLWSQMGYIQIAGPRFRTFQSLSAGDGSLNDILRGGHVNFGFILGGVDPNDPPTGRIEIKEITFTAPA